jgi:molybdopterin-guanine dinucleotide biosynthesis protein A
MGRPKQLVEIGGGTMVEHVVRALSEEVDEVVLLGDSPVPAALANLSSVADAGGCRGPMAGILGAMRARPDACWVVAPCDLPLLRRAAVGWLLGTRRTGAWAVLPSLEGFVEPLFAVYEPEAKTLLEEVAASGDYALHRLAPNSRVVTAEPPEALRQCWLNANTPQELLSLRTG